MSDEKKNPIPAGADDATEDIIPEKKIKAADTVHTAPAGGDALFIPEAPAEAQPKSDRRFIKTGEAEYVSVHGARSDDATDVEKYTDRLDAASAPAAAPADAPEKADTYDTVHAPTPGGRMIAAEAKPEAAPAAQQTDEALTGLVVGSGGNQSMVGSASVHVPGAAGETGSHIPGIPPMILADGPAGLRLTPHFRVLKSGKVLQLENRFAALMGEDKAEEDTAGAVDYYQYATAIPIATLLAQSWDLGLVKDMGRLVGREMEKFGVTLWLAPGMNIHRNPLCGRNFEYYSEDPLVAGLTAAAMTLGVQETPGVGVTPKHYACNNQEDNRSYENSVVSVRALREIYLRGFELCVRLAQPMSIMTSYNCINGVHSANHAELLNGVLRND